MISQSFQDPFLLINEKDKLKAIGQIIEKHNNFNLNIHNSSPREINQIKSQKQFPILKEKKDFDNYMGTKRAFIVSHERKANLIKKILDKNWDNQERNRLWNFKQQLKLI